MRVVVGALAVGLAVASACASATEDVSAAPQSVAGFVSVSGHRMFYECSGAGSPTVVLDAGSPDTSAVWRWMQPRIAKLTRVCAYDRAGLGRSAPAPTGRRTAKTQVAELRGLLKAAQIPTPYVVVGHSWGGLLARLFANSYPHLTAGVVLVDATTFPYQTPASAARMPHLRNREGIDIPSTITESNAIRTLGGLPLIVLGSNKPPHDPKFVAAQVAEAALSTDSINATALKSTHYIQRRAPSGQPDVVVGAVAAVIKAVRSHGRLLACRQVFPSAAAVRCL